MLHKLRTYPLETIVIPIGSEQSIYTPSALQIVLLSVHVPRGKFRVPFCPYSHVSVTEQLFLMAEVHSAIPPDALEACSAAEAAAEVPTAIKDVRANCLCASLLRTQIYATSWMSARAQSNKINNDKEDGHCCSFVWI